MPRENCPCLLPLLLLLLLQLKLLVLVTLTVLPVPHQHVSVIIIVNVVVVVIVVVTRCHYYVFEVRGVTVHVLRRHDVTAVTQYDVIVVHDNVDLVARGRRTRVAVDPTRRRTDRVQADNLTMAV